MNNGMKLILTATLAASLVAPAAVLGQGKQGAAKQLPASAKADKAPGKVDKTKLRNIRVKAPPRSSIKTNVSPGTWTSPRHRGNSPKFRPDREKDWVDPTGGKPPVKVPE